MATFKITWAPGQVTVEHKSDCATVEQFINSRFGAGVTPTAKVELVEGKSVAVKPAVKVKQEDANK